MCGDENDKKINFEVLFDVRYPLFFDLKLLKIEKLFVSLFRCSIWIIIKLTKMFQFPGVPFRSIKNS